ncbi:MAG: DUF4172 domain-containing protein [Deltaproteobacteria bacterium]|nr:DUF4172 domain-containing protein [Deltaproteobacteria bacterium]MBW2218810.1 DUF4172 domain-containing protein [Deltaproteobacteria bacterium]
MRYIWERASWPELYWDSDSILKLLGMARQVQGILIGETEYFELKMQADVLTDEAFMTSAI